MPYVTSIERLAEARGEARGKAALVLAQLDELVGCVLQEHRERIRELPAKQLDQLGKDLVHFQSLADLQRWFEGPGAIEG